MKKIIFVVAVLAGITVCGYLNLDEVKFVEFKTEKEETKSSLVNKQIEIQKLEKNVAEEENQNEIQTVQEVEKQEKVVKEEVKQEKNTQNVDNNNVTNNYVVKEEQKVEQVEQTIQSVIETSKTESVIEEAKPMVDEEYLRLSKLAVFATHSDCNSTSNAIGKEYAKQKDSNYRNTSCESVAYNGELLGYALKIYFTDSTFKYYE